MRSYFYVCVVMLSLLLSVAVGIAADAPGTSEIQKENAQLRKRVDNLEGELKAIREMLKKQSPPQPQLTEQERLELCKQILKECNTTKRAATVKGDLDVTLYGYIKMDAAYDSARTTNGNYAAWVDSETGRHNDSQFNMTTNQTRFGLKLKGLGNEQVKAAGLVEMDFYGGVSENKPHMRMRHAYMTFDWPGQRLQLLAGQTWDVISPLNPETVNFTPLWWCGNIGFRRPQIRVTQDIALSDTVDMRLQAAAVRTIGDAGDFTPGDSGEDAGFPTVQGRAALSFPTVGKHKTILGVSGHWGQQEFDTDAMDHNTEYDTWSVNVDLTQPICEKVAFKGEIHTGKNLAGYLGGIGQGTDLNLLNDIGATGGWGAVNIRPWDKWRFNVGAGAEAVKESDVGAGARTLNLAIFGNVIYQVVQNAAVMFELSHWHTEYKDLNDGNDVRFQLSFKYDF